jgi:hypothetical protein
MLINLVLLLCGQISYLLASQMRGSAQKSSK